MVMFTEPAGLLATHVYRPLLNVEAHVMVIMASIPTLVLLIWRYCFSTLEWGRLSFNHVTLGTGIPSILHTISNFLPSMTPPVLMIEMMTGLAAKGKHTYIQAFQI